MTVGLMEKTQSDMTEAQPRENQIVRIRGIADVIKQFRFIARIFKRLGGGIEIPEGQLRVPDIQFCNQRNGEVSLMLWNRRYLKLI